MKLRWELLRAVPAAVRVYFTGTDLRKRRRPRIVYIGASQRLYGLRWRRWDGRAARARGIFPFNTCVPSCVEGGITPYRVAVTLSRPRFCNGRYQYLRLTYKFLTGPRRGRRTRTSFGWVCS